MTNYDFPTTAAAWGDITGTLSDQTDLDTALGNKQPLDASLTSLALLGTEADRIAYTTAADTWAETPFTAFARTLLDDVDAPTARTTLGAGTGNVTKVGTPVNDQVGVWTGDGTLEGVSNFTFSGTALVVGAAGNATLSCPGAGASSEMFGSGATAAGASSLAIGNAASTPAANSVACGTGATTGATATAATAIGSAASASVNNATAVGASSVCSGTESVAVGRAISVTQQKSVAVGASATATAAGAVAIGYGADATAAGAIALGKEATADEANSCVMGSPGGSGEAVSTLYGGNGRLVAAPAAFTVTASGGSGTDISGGTLSVAGGRPTGAGVGGSVLFKTAPAGATGTTLRTLATRLEIDQKGNIVPGTAALATDATDGFPHCQSCAGAPSGTPTAFTGRVPMVVDTTNGRVYFYYGAAWHYAALT